MRRYIITGAPGSGKTVIIRQLELEGFSVVEEAATGVIAAAQAGAQPSPGQASGNRLYARFADSGPHTYIIGYDCFPVNTTTAHLGKLDRMFYSQAYECTSSCAVAITDPLTVEDVFAVVRAVGDFWSIALLGDRASSVTQPITLSAPTMWRL